MGVDCHGLLEITLSEKSIFSLPDEVMTLPEKLDALYDPLLAIWEDVEGVPHDEDRLWQLDKYNMMADDEEQGDQTIGLNGPFALSGSLMRHAIGIHHLNRWRSFLENRRGMRRRFRLTCQAIARQLGARRIVYIVEDSCGLICEHRQEERTFDELLDFFKSHWGPLPPISQLTGDVHRDFYFLEDFSPIESAQGPE